MVYKWQMLTRTNQIPDMLRMVKVSVLKIKHKALMMMISDRSKYGNIGHDLWSQDWFRNLYFLEDQFSVTPNSQ
jgi:hypothetical protein